MKTNINFKIVEHYFFAASIMLCYPFYAIGQLWLFIYDQKSADFYIKINKFTSDWTNSHLLLLLSIVLMIPAFMAIDRFLNQNRINIWSKASVFLISLAVFVLFGQFVIDLCLVEIFKLPKDQAYSLLENIKSNYIINALFYDNSQIFILFKFFDFALLAQIALGIALFKSKKMPTWALILFFIALMVTFLGILAHPVYGRIAKRFAYALFSVSFYPIAISLIKNNHQK
jgi:hypothetical protein